MALDTSNAWYTERDKLAIVGTSATNSQSYTDPPADKNVKVHVSKYDAPFASGNNINGTIYQIIASGDTDNPYPIVSNGTSATSLLPHGLNDGDLVKITGTGEVHDGVYTAKVNTGYNYRFYLLEGLNATQVGTEIGTWERVYPLGMDDSPNIPRQFHRALAYKVIAMGYEIQGSQEEDPNVLQLAGYWNQKFEAEIAEAKKYTNVKRNDSGYNIIPQDF